MTESLSGTLLGGRYRVGALLGQGGMGAVYEGMQEGLDRQVALKVLHSHLASEQELISRFKREAHAVATLGHPNVVQISDFQSNPGEPPFLVMELLRGESLRDLLKRRGTLPPERVAFIFQQVLAALEAAHAKDIVHRDIKPDNVFLTATSVQADLVKILDFGVAKILRAEDPNVGKLTRNGFVVGTLAYMAPEQATGDPLDGRADLYSVGACMYLALTGRKPYDGPTTPAILKAILTERHVPLAAVRQDIDLALAAIVDRALAKKPGDRFANAREMASALAPFAKPTPLEPTASEAPTLPRDEPPPTVGVKRAVPSNAPTLDAKALAKSAPTAQMKQVSEPAVTAKDGDQKRTLVSPGVPAAVPPKGKTQELEARPSATPPPRSMGPETLATIQLAATNEIEPSPDTEPPAAIGEGARAPLIVAPTTGPLMTTVRSRTEPVAPPLGNVSTTLKMKASDSPPTPTPVTGPPPNAPAIAMTPATPVEPPKPARVQVPIAPAPRPGQAHAARAPVVIVAPKRPARSSTSAILIVTFLVLFGIAVVALGVGLFALKWFSDATDVSPEPTATSTSTASVATATTVTPTVDPTATANPPGSATADPSATAPRPRSNALGAMAAPAKSSRTAPSASQNVPMLVPSAMATAMASAAPALMASATTLVPGIHTAPIAAASSTATPPPRVSGH